METWLVQTTMMLVRLKATRSKVDLATVSSTIWKSIRGEKFKLKFVAKIFSLNVLPRNVFHMLRLTIVHDLIQECYSGTAVAVTMLSRAHTV